jgi:hypothetical protein
MPQTAVHRAPLEYTLQRLLRRYTMHDVLHTMVEICYQRAGQEEDTRHGTIYYTSQWREVARYLTGVEAACVSLELKP